MLIYHNAIIYTYLLVKHNLFKIFIIIIITHLSYVLFFFNILIEYK